MKPDQERLKERANQAEAGIKETAQDAMAFAEHKATRVGEAMESAADDLREHLPGSGKTGQAAGAVVRGVKQTSVYLQQQGISGVVEDLELLIRRYPLQTLLLGLGCGYLLSRVRTD